MKRSVCIKNLSISFLATVALYSGGAVADLEQRVERMERLLDSQSLVDMMLQVEQMQNELRHLRGEIESQRHDVDSMKKRQRDLYLDIDRRLRQQETGSTASIEPRQKEITAPVESSKSYDTNSGNVSDNLTANEQVDYQNALGVLKEGRYPQSIAAFNAFLKKYPQSLYAANAQYWIGEAYYVSREFKLAQGEFQKVVEGYADSTKVADAMLKIGFIHYEQAEWDQARNVLNHISSRFPKTTASRLAENRLQKMKVEGH
ncbi:MAG: tol-pal system protein YbgF [Nitrosopumilus sp.]|nr:tol-pal system protein YbgF [Nitrosopumilus sp.]